ncbi:hypothetical protein JXO52_09235 [bacterium]|nr:hypothetical protein [bacterium]
MKHINTFCVALFIVLELSASVNGYSVESRETGNPYTPGSCTIFAVSQGELVYFGNNEDWYDPQTWYWIMPSSDSTYGVLCFGYGNLFPQGGVNEMGLAFDANSLPRITVQKNPEGIKPYQAIVNTIIMKQCATVEEAIATAEAYDWSQCYGGRLDGQFLLADASGDAVVIGADSAGRIVFTRKDAGDGFLVSTNFNRAYPYNRLGRYPCPRYETTVSMLSRIPAEEDPGVDYLVSILDAVHAEGRRINTLYSNIIDLKNGVVYLYYWHQFQHPVTLRVSEVIAGGQKPALIKTLFPQAVVDRAAAEHKLHMARPLYIVGGAILFFVLLIASLLRFGARRISESNDTGVP